MELIKYKTVLNAILPSAKLKIVSPMKEKILKELNESIDGVEKAMGENQYDNGYLDALYMVRDRIIKPLEDE